MTDRIKIEKDKFVNVYLLMPECFEHVLLCSKYFNYDKDIFKYFSLKYDNTEEFCESEILYVTSNTNLVCNHKTGILSDCWIKECIDCVKECKLFYSMVC